MNDDFNLAGYSLEELQAASEHIDAKRFPQRAAAIRRRVEELTRENGVAPSDTPMDLGPVDIPQSEIAWPLDHRLGTMVAVSVAGAFVAPLAYSFAEVSWVPPLVLLALWSVAMVWLFTGRTTFRVSDGALILKQQFLPFRVLWDRLALGPNPVFTVEVRRRRRRGATSVRHAVVLTTESGAADLTERSFVWEADELARQLRALVKFRAEQETPAASPN